jgi:hypothetical protein
MDQSQEVDSSRSQLQKPLTTALPKDKNTQKKTILKDLEELDKLDNSMEEPKINLTEGLQEGTPDDFGYYTIFHTGLEDCDKNIKNVEKINQNGIKMKGIFYKSGNFMSFLNKKNDKNTGKPQHFKSPLELLVRWVRDEKSGNNFLNIDNPEVIKNKKASNQSMRNTVTKKMTNNPSMRSDQPNDHLVRNTQNSCVYAEQLNELKKNDIEAARNRNYKYVLRKVKYEVSLILFQIEKYQKYKSNNPKQIVKITAEKPFLDLERNSRKFIKKYNDFIETHNLYSPAALSRLQHFSLEARTFLLDFMNGIISNYEKIINIKRVANEKSISFIVWKTKLSQLVGIWDVSNSNGTEITTSYKYLVLKRFLNIRAQGRQMNKNYIILSEEQKLRINNSCFENTNDRNTLIHPLGIMKETDTLRKVMEIIVCIFLLYSFVTVPVRLLMKIESNTLKLVEKFVDMYFYIDIMLYFRTSYKDKSNEDKFNILDIAKRYFSTFFYIDFISTVPWYYFFYSSAFKDTIRVFTHIFKILRISKLLPILHKLEELKIANQIRLIKLLLIFFLIAHWMSCILFFGTQEGLLYAKLSPFCYLSDFQKNKYTLNNECIYVFSFYNSVYSIPGQYTSFENAVNHLSAFNEYLILLTQFLLGQFLSAYTFGGVTSIIRNLDQGSNFFIEKTDLLREHMFFYNIDKEVRNDVIVYYDYLWQRHKDIIYGKHHFNLLSKSLTEKFENFNLLGNEIYLHTFHKLNNEKLTGHVLRELRKVILLPYEILYEEGSLIQGLFILTNGDIEFKSYKTENVGHSYHSVEFSKIVKIIEEHRKSMKDNYDEEAKEMSVIFPFVSIFIKTGRSYQRCSATDFTDLLYLPLDSFDEIISSFPVEMHSLKHEVMKDVDRRKIFDNESLFQTLAIPSSRSVGKNYEKEYTKLNIWIPIPIPISQRKIATNYMESFVKKVKNQHREILLSSDMNICFNSMMIVGFLKSENKGEKGKDKEENNEKNALIQQGDQLDLLKNLSRTIGLLSEEFSISAKKLFDEDKDKDK